MMAADNIVKDIGLVHGVRHWDLRNLGSESLSDKGMDTCGSSWH